MDGHSLLNLKYEEAMNLLQSSGTEVEILLSQVNTDKEIFESRENPCYMKANEEDDEFQMPVRHIKDSDHQDSIEKSCVSLIRHEPGLGGMSLIPMVHPEPCAKSVEDSYLNNIHFETAIDVVSGGGGSEMVSTSVTTSMKSMQQLHIEKPSTPVRSSHDGIRAVCCVMHAEDD
jgi:hypothetical protein